MKTFAMCIMCAQEGVEFVPRIAVVDYFDEGIGYFECPEGHKTSFITQKQKFEMLLDSGTEALIEGFTMEACASYSAALERFYEFTIESILTARGVSEEILSGLKREMSRQSERQLGAFMVLHVLEFEEFYKFSKIKLPNGMSYVEFRNSIIHKGLIPTVDDSKNFASLVYGEIWRTWEKCKNAYPHMVPQMIMANLAAKHKNVKPGYAISTVSHVGLFSISNDSNPSSFADALAAFKRQASARRPQFGST